jgi:release factor glutamine methyltransferase
MAHHVPGLQITTIDLSPAATAVARENARRHRVESRIEFRVGDAFAALTSGREFDLIVSNPPYIPTAAIEALEPEVREFDPRMALDGGPDGLAFYRRLATEGLRWLKSDGRMMLELGHDQALAARGILEAQMWIVEAIESDYSRIPRILIARRS